MPVAYTCPHCHRAGTAPDRLAGTAAACPACRQALVIPAAAPPSPPPFNGPAVYDAYPPAPAEEDNSAGDTARTAAAVRLVLWLLCLGWVAVCFAMFVVSFGQAGNVMQQAAIGVHWCMWLMAGFFAVYAIDRALIGGRR